MTRLSQAQAVEFIERFNTAPDFIAVTHVEAFLAEDVQDVLAELSQFAGDIDPDSFEVTPDAIEDMGIFGAKIIIRTTEAV